MLNALQWCAGYFERQAIESARLDAELLLAHAIDRDRMYLYLNYDKPLKQQELERYRGLIAQRGKRVPLAYLVQNKEFYSRDFKIQPGVFIPRPETELLVEHAIKYVQTQSQDLRVLDLCCGSGVIGITLALELEPGVSVCCADISQQALDLCRENAESLQVPKHIFSLVKSDLFETIQQDFDLLVCNPPYVNPGCIDQLAPELQHEPRHALDGGNDGLELPQTVLSQARSHIRPGGMLILEIGDTQAQQLSLFARHLNYHDVTVYNDYAGKHRILAMKV